MADRTIFFLVFDEVEVLDFTGPWDVFSMAQPAAGMSYDLEVVSESGGTITALHGLRLLSDYSLADCPTPGADDVVIIPGGSPWLLTQFSERYPKTIRWIREVRDTAGTLASVCAGALLLAQAGVLAGQKATTHHGALDMLRDLAPDAEVVPGVRYVDNDDSPIACSAGVSAGLDLSFYLLGRLEGAEARTATQTLMEYNASPNWVYGA